MLVFEQFKSVLSQTPGCRTLLPLEALPGGAADSEGVIFEPDRDSVLDALVEMYLDNSENADRSLPAYSLSDLSLGYKIKPRKVVKEIDLGVDFRNAVHHAHLPPVHKEACEGCRSKKFREAR